MTAPASTETDYRELYDKLVGRLTTLQRDLEVMAVDCDEQVAALQGGDQTGDEFKVGCAGSRAVTLRECARRVRMVFKR